MKVHFICVTFVIDACITKIFCYLIFKNIAVSNLINKNSKLSSFDDKSPICRICNSPPEKLKFPFQTGVNGLFLENILQELRCLNNLELVFITKRLLFEKTFIMPKRHILRIHGSIVNISANVRKLSNQLHERNCEEIILAKFKKKCYS